MGVIFPVRCCYNKRSDQFRTLAKLAKLGDRGIRGSGDPGIRGSGDPGIRRSGDPAIRGSGDHASLTLFTTCKSGMRSPPGRGSGDPGIRGSGDPGSRLTHLVDDLEVGDAVSVGEDDVSRARDSVGQYAPHLLGDHPGVPPLVGAQPPEVRELLRVLVLVDLHRRDVPQLVLSVELRRRNVA